jgi:hypothetical protein
MRRDERVLAVLRLGFTAASVAAIAYMAAVLETGHEFHPGNYFSFFTIQSNILAAAVLAAAALVRPDERSAVFDALRGAGTLYIAITGVVFAVLLSGHQEDLDTHVGWVNFVVHTLIPIVVAADWLLDPPRRRLQLRVAVLWLGYPLAWFVYTLVRGAAEGWYPYPFVDVSEHGYGRVFLNGVVLLVFFAAAAFAFVAVGNYRARTARDASSAG